MLENVCLVGLMFFVLHTTHDGKDANIVSAAHDMFVGFGGALLGALAGNSSRQQMADRRDTTLPAPPPPPGGVTTTDMHVGKQTDPAHSNSRKGGVTCCYLS